MRRMIAGIAACSIAVGTLELIQQKTKVKMAKKEGKKVHKPYGVYEKYLKRPIDLILSISAFIFLSPLFLFLCILVALKMKGNPFFVQERPGRDEKIFKLLKFRTMTDECGSDGMPLPDEKRITKFGSTLRRTSLDELPELINIICGDMSFVGPRPLLKSYLPYYTDQERHRHDVRPGLTGRSQICGRNFLKWEKRFEQDIKYVNHITFFEDLKIMVCTVKKVLSEENIMNVDMDKKKVGFDDLDKERKKLRLYYEYGNNLS